MRQRYQGGDAGQAGREAEVGRRARGRQPDRVEHERPHQPRVDQRAGLHPDGRESQHYGEGGQRPEPPQPGCESQGDAEQPGILAITSESTTGMLRQTLTAVPQRRTLLMAKALVVGVISLIAGQLSSFAVFFVSQAVLGTRGIGVTLASPYALASVLGAGFSCMVMGLVGLGVGAVLRSSAGGFIVIFALLFVVPALISLLPDPWNERIGSLTLPMASNLLPGRIPDAWLPPAGAALVLLGYIALALAAASAAISRRDP
ncbi:hypothetical protein [Nonomuraea sp. 10N515B]|uniref:hypothetical protein n=1 Tax=Nonomuraea sp. 10N515B TaxID=3457422 RepID=UPI003FCEA804